MKTKYLSLFAVLFVALITASCRKEPNTNDLIDDKDKIDIKGSLSNGDMRYPNIEAGYWGKTVYVYFHEYMGECIVSISQPLSRYHLVISNGTDKAEGWFNNFRIVAHKP